MNNINKNIYSTFFVLALLPDIHSQTTDGIDTNDDGVPETNPATQNGGQCQNQLIEDRSECESSGWVWFEEEVNCSLMDVNEDCVMDVPQEDNLLNSFDIKFEILLISLLMIIIREIIMFI